MSMIAQAVDARSASTAAATSLRRAMRARMVHEFCSFEAALVAGPARPVFSFM